MSGQIDNQKMQAAANDIKMQDDESQRSERKHLSALGMNRKQRRKFAKNYGLFQDHSGEAWRIGNRHMKGDKQNKETVHRLGDQQS